MVFRPNLRNLKCGDERGWWDGILVFRASGASTAGEVMLNHTEIIIRRRLSNWTSIHRALEAGVCNACRPHYAIGMTGSIVVTQAVN